MAEEKQFKRNVAFKLRIGEVLIGKPIMNGEKFLFIELGSEKIFRVNIIGSIVERYDSEGESKYSFLTLDDGSGQIKLKIFGDDVERFKEVSQGQIVLVIGLLRSFNNEIYITPEIIKEQDSKYLLIRKLELDKGKNTGIVSKEVIVAIKDKILDLIKNSEEEGGIDKDKIIMNLQDASPQIINQELNKLLEDGIIFEPRPGKVRWLG